jgi:hypothetical protein
VIENKRWVNSRCTSVEKPASVGQAAGSRLTLEQAETTVKKKAVNSESHSPLFSESF